jgi:hypothetical protein
MPLPANFTRARFEKAASRLAERNALNRELEEWIDEAIRPAVERAAHRVVERLAERGIALEAIDGGDGGFSFAGSSANRDDWLTATWVTTVRFGAFNDPPVPAGQQARSEGREEPRH